MSSSILNVTDGVYSDDSIENLEFHSYQPYASTTLNKSDEIRIPITDQNILPFLHSSFLDIEGKLLNNDTASETLFFINNGIAFLFDSIRLEANGVTVDFVRNVGLTSLLKGYCSFNESDGKRLEIAGWSPSEHPKTIVDKTTGNFNVCIPLRTWMGFFEDFRKVLLRARLELVLMRSNTDLNATITNEATDEPTVQLNRITWRVPHVSVSDQEKLRLLKVIDSNQFLNIAFRSWELQEYPLLPETDKHTWAVKTSSQLEKPRFVIFGFQTDRKNSKGRDMSLFDPCDLTNIKVFLNSQMYPYDNLNLNFTTKHYAVLYEMYAAFQQAYYYSSQAPCLIPNDFFNHNGPFVVIDCSHQNETLKSGVVDLRIEFETNQKIPAKTSAYCLILHDRLIRYSPLTGEVKSF